MRRLLGPKSRDFYDAVNEEALYLRGLFEHRLFSFFKALTFDIGKEDTITLGFKSEAPLFYEPRSPNISFLPPLVGVYNENFTDYSLLFDYEIYLEPATYYATDRIWLEGAGWIEGEFNITSPGFYTFKDVPHGAQILWKNEKEELVEEGDMVPIVNPGHFSYYSRIFKLWAQTGGWDTYTECMILQIRRLKELMFSPSIENTDAFLKSLYCYDVDAYWGFVTPELISDNPYYSQVKRSPGVISFPVFHTYETVSLPFRVTTYTATSTIERWFYVPLEFKEKRYLIEVPADRIDNYVRNSDFTYYDVPNTEATSFDHGIIPEEAGTIVVRYGLANFESRFYPPLHILFEGLATLRAILPQRTVLLLAIDRVVLSSI